MLIVVDDVPISLWEPLSSKQVKLEPILSLKTAQERSLLNGFAKRYSETMGDVRAGEIILSRLIESSRDNQFGVDDISKVLSDHKQALKSEIVISSQAFEKILDETVGDSSLDEHVLGILPVIRYADLVSYQSRVLAATCVNYHESAGLIR